MYIQEISEAIPNRRGVWKHFADKFDDGQTFSYNYFIALD